MLSTRLFFTVAVAILFTLPAIAASPPHQHFSSGYTTTLNLTLDLGPVPELFALDSKVPAFGVLPAKYETIELVKKSPKRSGKRAAKGGNAMLQGDTIGADARHYHLLL